MKMNKIYIGNESDYSSHKSTLEEGDIVFDVTGIHENELDSSLQGKVNQVKTNAGSPTTSTIGYKGQLLIDTTNGNLYQCTNVASNVYTWSQVGASHLYKHEFTCSQSAFTQHSDAELSMTIISTIGTNMETSDAVAKSVIDNALNLSLCYGSYGKYGVPAYLDDNTGGKQYYGVVYRSLANMNYEGIATDGTDDVIYGLESFSLGQDYITQIA